MMIARGAAANDKVNPANARNKLAPGPGLGIFNLYKYDIV